MKQQRNFLLSTLVAFAALFFVVSFVGSTNAHASTSDPWWKQFNDDQLDQLIEKARVQNPQLRSARLKAALDESTTWVTFSPMLPTLQLAASTSLAPTSALGFGLPFSFPTLPSMGPVPLDKQFESLGADNPPAVYVGGAVQLQAAWRIDPGVSYFRYAASQKDALATKADRDEATLRLTQQVTQTYFDLLTATKQESIFAGQLNAQQTLLKVVELRFSEGSATSVDVLQQRQQVAASRSQQHPARTQVEALTRQLRGLLAMETDEKLELDLQRSLPTLPTEVDVDLDDVMQERPDIRAARTRLEAASNRSTSAFLAFFPSLNLSAQAGPQYQYLTEYNDNWGWGVGASLSIPLFMGQTIANYNTSRIGVSLAKENVHALEVTAALEVEVAQIQARELRLQVAATAEQQQAAEKTVQAARQRYLAGLLPYQSVLLAENAFFMSSLSSLDQNRRLALAHLSLLDATAGTFADGLGEEPARSNP
ncbi:MAG: TolC family protein [Deltaproteobacteria bacterium]|nr:TolC family protein [Deltaproteobacteria bacterium]